MFALLMILILVQCLGLCCRMTYDAINYTMVVQVAEYVGKTEGPEAAQIVLQTRNSTVTLQETGIPYEEIIILYLMGTFEAIFICGNSVTILIISLFVSNVFLKVVRKTSGIKDSNKAKRAMVVINMSSFTSMAVMMLLIFIGSWTFFFTKIGMLKRDEQTYVFALAYILFALNFIFQAIIAHVSFSHCSSHFKRLLRIAFLKRSNQWLVN